MEEEIIDRARFLYLTDIMALKEAVIQSVSELASEEYLRFIYANFDIDYNAFIDYLARRIYENR